MWNNHYRPQRSWGKVIFSQASVILFTGGVCMVPEGAWSGGAWSRGVPGPGGPSPGGMGAWSWGGLVETPRDGCCCGRYASYWNAFLLSLILRSLHSVAAWFYVLTDITIRQRYNQRKVTRTNTRNLKYWHCKTGGPGCKLGRVQN